MWVCATFMAACGPSDPCPEGYRDVRAVCHPEDAGTLPTCEQTGDYEGFGDECDTQDDCACPAPICNDQFGYCTQVNCMDAGEPPVCPPDWTCTDVQGLPGVPPDVHSICLR